MLYIVYKYTYIYIPWKSTNPPFIFGQFIGSFLSQLYPYIYPGSQPTHHLFSAFEKGAFLRPSFIFRRLVLVHPMVSKLVGAGCFKGSSHEAKALGIELPNHHEARSAWMDTRKLGSMISKWVSSPPYKWGIPWGYNPLILTIDPNFQRDIQVERDLQRSRCLFAIEKVRVTPPGSLTFSHQNIGWDPKRKGSYSKHPFSGTNC